MMRLWRSIQPTATIANDILELREQGNVKCYRPYPPKGTHMPMSGRQLALRRSFIMGCE
jgi:hypothetical protein